MTEKVKIKAHPLTMAEYARTAVLFLGLFWNLPVAAVTVVAAVAIISLIRTKKTGIVIDGEHLYINKGIIITKTASINISSVTAVIATRSLIDIIAGSTEIAILTKAGAVCGKKGIRVFSKKEAPLCAALGFEDNGKQCESNFFQVLLYAVSSTSVTAGALVLLPILRQIDALLTDNGLGGAADRIGKIGERVFGISPIINLVAMFILITFALSLLLSLARYAGHKRNFAKETLSVSFGVLPRKTVYMRKVAINATFEIKPPLLMLLKRSFIKADIAGVAGDESDAGLRSERKRGVYVSLPTAGEKNDRAPLAVRDGGQRRHFATTFYFACAGAPFFLMVQMLLPWLTDLLLFLICVLSPMLLYRFYLAKRARYTNMDIIGGNAYYITGTRAVRARFRPTSVGVISLKTFPYDRKVRMCTVKVILRSEFGAKIKVKYVSATEISEQLKKLHIK